MTHLELPGRILFLCNDGEKVRAQLSGTNLSLGDAGQLRNDISTDEITPGPSLVYVDEQLGRHVYTGFSAGDTQPINKDAALAGKFSVTVGGRRYGKGSSREHSPVAERYAGIRLVIAESFERIYRQNADNVGLYTSTDFGLIERIQRGEPIDIEELLAPRDKLAASILRMGGLLLYGREHLKSVRRSHVSEVDHRPLTLTQKILARNVVETNHTSGELIPGQGAFVRADWRYIIEVYTGMAAHMMHATFGRPLKLVDVPSILGFAEHASYIDRHPKYVHPGKPPVRMRVMHETHEEFLKEYGIRSHGYLPGPGGSEGICHPLMAERYALPGQVLVGTDSHTPHSGALGCLAFGVGTTDMASAMLTGAVRITVPETLRIEFNGEVPAGITGKDLALNLLAHPKIRGGLGLGKVFEFSGTSMRYLSIDERTTLTNMVAELGGFAGIVEPDEKTCEFLRERRGIDFTLEPWMKSDPGASYSDTIVVETALLSPMVAAPGDPGNGIPLSSLTERPKIDIAFAGSCTGGKREDFDAYHAVLSWAADRGMRVAEGVEFYLQFGTMAVRDYCEAKGYSETFQRVGATVLLPDCGACANSGPGASLRSDQVTVSAQNRNFPGRSGPGQIWLASPPTVAASAIGGELLSFAELKSRFDEQAIGADKASLPLEK
ncbi:aconitase family protein [Variovorax sp. LjRoot84]|uniref:aconitase family protein n=1 Tax=Variovorax sp. LjRoot84 TaxID=3342340 RepID=UPI003ECDA3DC